MCARDVSDVVQYIYHVLSAQSRYFTRDALFDQQIDAAKKKLAICRFVPRTRGTFLDKWQVCCLRDVV